MIPSAIFHERRDKHCLRCEFWKGVCLKGHALQSPAGCPLKKFPPVEGADYLPNLPVPAAEPHPNAPRPCCQDMVVIPEMTWVEVLAHFQKTMAEWKAAGYPLAADDILAERTETCKGCPRYKWFHCTVCKCIVYTKAKLLTESCPEQRWKR